MGGRARKQLYIYNPVPFLPLTVLQGNVFSCKYLVNQAIRLLLMCYVAIIIIIGMANEPFTTTNFSRFLLNLPLSSYQPPLLNDVNHMEALWFEKRDICNKGGQEVQCIKKSFLFLIFFLNK